MMHENKEVATKDCMWLLEIWLWEGVLEMHNQMCKNLVANFSVSIIKD
jgi:hypothetical protein